MKKLLLLPFTLLIMGVLFFGCEKDQVQFEESYLDSTKMVSSERSIDCLQCGGCCCRLISLQGLGNAHRAQLCYLNTIYDIPNPYPPHSMGAPSFNSCTIPATNCNPQPIVVNSYDNIVFPNDLEPHPDAEYNPYFPHGYFAGFCSQPNNLFQVCNPHNYVIEMVFNCEFDVQNAWIVFELQPFECKVFRIQDCAMTECDEIL